MKAAFPMLVCCLVFVQCTKQGQKITHTLGDTTAEIVSNTIDSVLNVDSVNADTLTVFQKNINKYQENGKAIAMYTGSGKNLRAIFQNDAKGSPVVVLSENGKDLPWLYQSSKTDSTAVYKAESIEFVVKGNGAILIQKGKTYNLTAK